MGAIGWAEGFATNSHHFEMPDEKTKHLISQKNALAIWGEKDRTLNHQYFLPLFKQVFPNSRIHVLPNVGHYSLEDASEEITQLVMKFIAAN